MAFKMKGSPHKNGGIQGSRVHKKSIARAMQPLIGESTRTKADSSLVNQAYRLGQSFKPAKVNFKLDIPEIKLPKGDKEEEIKGCTYENATNYNPDATVDDGSCEYPDRTEIVTNNDNGDGDGDGGDGGDGNGDGGPATVNNYMSPSDGNASNSFNTVYGDDPLTAEIRDTSELQAGQVEDLMDSLRFSSGQGVEILTDTQRANIKKDFENMTFLERNKLLKDLQGSVMQKRDDRIYKNARAGSVLRKKMRKSGYTPPEFR
jgi:hypothetical protein|tara:strand:+ start:923 stop:1705 length:783 start_codon:yes stop_codon:yes gene_type:complete